MLPFLSKITKWIKDFFKKPRLIHVGVICFAVFFLFVSLNYALPTTGSEGEDTSSTDITNILDNLFLFRSQQDTISFQITDPSGASTDPGTALSNQFAYANQNKLASLAPGDKLDLSYEITNTGTKALDIRETYYILSFIQQTPGDLDFAIFADAQLMDTVEAYKGVSALSSQKIDKSGRLYSFTSDPYTLSGSNETVSGSPTAKTSNRYMVFNWYGGNETQGKPVYIIATLEFKEHSSDEWERSITETVVLGGLTRTMEYRTGTDVYISCDFVALENINSENPGYVTFTVTDPTGTTSTLTFNDFCSPVIGIQRAYIPFHIPDVTGNLSVTISSSENVLCDTKQIIATVVSSNEVTPPDPTLDMAISVSASLPIFNESETHKWVTYSASKNAAGEWAYTEHTHTASLNTNFLLSPDSNTNPETNNTMRSGYGITGELRSEITAADPVYNAQNVYCFFPEFGYKDYSRKLEALSQTQLTTTWAFQVNKYSHRSSRVHYIPPAYPDGLYTVFATVRDAWTPVGELKGSVTAEVNIIGSVYDDWYVTERN